MSNLRPAKVAVKLPSGRRSTAFRHKKKATPAATAGMLLPPSRVATAPTAPSALVVHDRGVDLERAEHLMAMVCRAEDRLNYERSISDAGRWELSDQAFLDQNQASILRNRHDWVDPRVIGRRRKEARVAAISTFATTATLEYVAANDPSEMLRWSAQKQMDEQEEQRQHAAGPSTWNAEASTDQRIRTAGSAYVSDATLADAARDPNPAVREAAALKVDDWLRMYRP